VVIDSVYGRSAPESILPGSVHPTSAPSAVVLPQVLGRSAPTELAFVFVYVKMLHCAVLSSDSADVNEDVNV